MKTTRDKGGVLKKKIIIWTRDQVIGFSDGIFSFSITLQVLSLITLQAPGNGQSILSFFWQNFSVFLSFAFTFYIINRLWMSHARLFAIIREFDDTIIELNSGLLFFIAVFPFAASLLGTHIGNTDAVIMYAMCFAAVGTLQYSIARHARKNNLLIQDERLNDRFMKIFNRYTLSTPAVSLVSILIALASPTLAEIFWIALLFLKIGFRQYYRNSHSAELDLNII